MNPPSLRIATPCHEPWEAMTPNGAGRHCAACDKTVVDVTAMAPVAARDYLARELPVRIQRGERVCVRSHADRSGRLLRPGVKRRLLTNGLAAVLAVAAAGYAGFGPGLAAAEGDGNGPLKELPQDPPNEPLMGKPAIRGDVMLGEIAAPTVPAVTDPATAITIRVEPATFLVIATDAKAKEIWRVNLAACGMPADSAHWPHSLSLVGNTVVVTGGDVRVNLAVADGAVRGGCGAD